ncbi:MAG: sensor domain-containing diguanylate cyclase [Luteimonas sp.]
MRALGLGLGFLGVATVFYQNGAHPLFWALLVLYGFGWPHLAHLLARRSADPAQAELRHIVIDSAMGGAWIALMAFDALPSLLFVGMLATAKVFGGRRVLARAFLAQCAACLAVAALLRFPFAPATSLLTMLGCAPLLVLYPLAIVAQAFALSHRDAQRQRVQSVVHQLDALTGLSTRRRFEQAVAVALSGNRRDGRPAALLLVDIDEFKQINDRYGHPLGDDVLQRVATILCTCIRGSDVASRYGGDEFSLLLYQADLAGALDAAERIRAAVHAARFKRAPDLRCTVSIGVATATRDMDDLRAWVHRADSALYRSKAAGRNRVSTPPDLP